MSETPRDGNAGHRADAVLAHYRDSGAQHAPEGLRATLLAEAGKAARARRATGNRPRWFHWNWRAAGGVVSVLALASMTLLVTMEYRRNELSTPAPAIDEARPAPAAIASPPPQTVTPAEPEVAPRAAPARPRAAKLAAPPPPAASAPESATRFRGASDEASRAECEPVLKALTGHSAEIWHQEVGRLDAAGCRETAETLFAYYLSDHVNITAGDGKGAQTAASPSVRACPLPPKAFADLPQPAQRAEIFRQQLAGCRDDAAALARHYSARMN